MIKTIFFVCYFIDECNERVLAKVEGPVDFKCTESAVAEVFEVCIQ